MNQRTKTLTVREIVEHVKVSSLQPEESETEVEDLYHSQLHFSLYESQKNKTFSADCCSLTSYKVFGLLEPTLRFLMNFFQPRVVKTPGTTGETKILHRV